MSEDTKDSIKRFAESAASGVTNGLSTQIQRMRAPLRSTDIETELPRMVSVHAGPIPAAVLAADSPSGFGHERLVTCLEIVMHPEDYAQLAESVGEASGGAGVRGVMVRSNPNMTKGTIGQRMSDGSWRFTSVGETTREGER